ncbi:basic endochitinase C-like isoform X2 [Typha angustifolia]|uniref:basic endochitinase C-like isoform X2 n=1 Tax=Typha angustifolia TaxID=59011 RepID=UPI003C304BBE
MAAFIFAILTFSSLLPFGTLAEQCGRQADGKLRPNEQLCRDSGRGGGLASLISREDFEILLKRRTDHRCAGSFYTYEAFVEAADSFPAFVRTGDNDTRKRELAAFLGQTSQATTDGKYAWGYCFVEQQVTDGTAYCTYSTKWPCVPGKKYFGRGPIQISYNYNYGPAGEAIDVGLLNDPDLVATDPVISFKTALWFWMTERYNKPSCHEVITGQWKPMAADVAANRLPGYGVITNIITGGAECGHGPDERVKDRIGYYQRYCDILGVGLGDNLDCYNQGSFGTLVDVMK